MSTCIKCLVSGKVQGVWYRGNTQDRARELGLNGYAHNLPDGRVEVLACGAEQSLNELKAWLWHGPRMAEVIDVQCETKVHVNPQPRDFSIG